MVHITKSGMEEKNVIIPENIYEQQKIGIFFKKIDEMIQLQQSKVNKLKDIKSAYPVSYTHLTLPTTPYV